MSAFANLAQRIQGPERKRRHPTDEEEPTDELASFRGPQTEDPMPATRGDQGGAMKEPLCLAARDPAAEEEEEEEEKTEVSSDMESSTEYERGREEDETVRQEEQRLYADLTQKKQSLMKDFYGLTKHLLQGHGHFDSKAASEKENEGLPPHVRLFRSAFSPPFLFASSNVTADTVLKTFPVERGRVPSVDVPHLQLSNDCRVFLTAPWNTLLRVKEPDQANVRVKMQDGGRAVELYNHRMLQCGDVLKLWHNNDTTACDNPFLSSMKSNRSFCASTAAAECHLWDTSSLFRAPLSSGVGPPGVGLPSPLAHGSPLLPAESALDFTAGRVPVLPGPLVDAEEEEEIEEEEEEEEEDDEGVRICRDLPSDAEGSSNESAKSHCSSRPYSSSERDSPGLFVDSKDHLIPHGLNGAEGDLLGDPNGLVQCSHCEKQCRNKSSLLRHMKQHLEPNKSYQCDKCKKTFKTNSSLKQHMHIHSSVKPFKCDVCNKCYTQFSNLCRHKRMHSECRSRIKCDLCGAEYTTSHSLEKHKATCSQQSAQNASSSQLGPPTPATLTGPVLPAPMRSTPSLPGPDPLAMRGLSEAASAAAASGLGPVGLGGFGSPFDPAYMRHPPIYFMLLQAMVERNRLALAAAGPGGRTDPSSPPGAPLLLPPPPPAPERTPPPAHGPLDGAMDSGLPPQLASSSQMEVQEQPLDLSHRSAAPCAPEFPAGVPPPPLLSGDSFERWFRAMSNLHGAPQVPPQPAPTPYEALIASSRPPLLNMRPPPLPNCSVAPESEHQMSGAPGGANRTACLNAMARRAARHPHERSQSRGATAGAIATDGAVLGGPAAAAASSSGASRFPCSVCSKSFPRQANLNRHMRTHTGEQPYSCPYCDRLFSISSNMQRHVRNIHKQMRPHRCPTCSKKFAQRTNLERHLRLHERYGADIPEDAASNEGSPGLSSGEETDLTGDTCEPMVEDLPEERLE